MNWKMTLASAAFAVSALVPSAALADGPHIGVSVNFPPMGVHVHTAGCNHGDVPPAPPQGVPQQTGRYELRTVNRWVPGYTQQVYVPGECFTKGRHHKWKQKTYCTDGHYENQWVEGRYEQVQQWVWVDYGPMNQGQAHYGFGRHTASR